MLKKKIKILESNNMINLEYLYESWQNEMQIEHTITKTELHMFGAGSNCTCVYIIHYEFWEATY